MEKWRSRRPTHAAAWDSNTFYKAPIPGYNALHDFNLRTHYEKKTVRSQLFHNHLVDKQGRILQDNKTKICIIEQEFGSAADEERKREVSDRYERSKLDSKKMYHRGQQRRLLRSMHQRERERERRGEFWSRASNFLPPPPSSLPGATSGMPGAIMSVHRRSDGKRAPATHRPSTSKPRPSVTVQDAHGAATPSKKAAGADGKDTDSSDSSRHHSSAVSTASSSHGYDAYAVRRSGVRKSQSVSHESQAAGSTRRVSLLEPPHASTEPAHRGRGGTPTSPEAKSDLRYDSLSDYDDGA